MIRVHTMFYSSEPEAFRAFLRDKLKFPYTDVGGGWLIFDMPEADMAAIRRPGQRRPACSPSHCDDIEKTVAELKGRGVEFTEGIADHGYGLVTHFKMPGDCKVQLYQPRYTKNKVKKA